MQERQIKKVFILVLSACAVSSASIIFVPFAIGKDGELNILGYIAGGLFWAGLILGIVGYIMLSKKAIIKDPGGPEEKKFHKILRVCSNPPAKVMDGVMLIGAAGTIYCMIRVSASQILAVIFLLFLVAGIYMHFLLNGKIYRHLWEKANTENMENTLNIEHTQNALDKNEGGMQK